MEDSFSCSVSSKAPLGHLLQVVNAKDIDRSDKDNLLFDITAGNEKGIFSIHETSGNLAWKINKNSYHLN